MSRSDWLRPGIISVICGCMFAGKTDELIRRLSVLHHAKKNIIIFKPKLEKRYAPDKVVSHNNLAMAAYCVQNTEEIVKIVHSQGKIHPIDVIAFDEVQFLPKDLFPYIEKWVKKGKIIIAAGLDKDYWNQYDSLMSRLLVRADLVTKLSAICNVCNDLAYRTQRIKNNQPVSYFHPKILIGGANNYQARCNNCYKEINENDVNKETQESIRTQEFLNRLFFDGGEVVPDALSRVTNFERFNSKNTSLSENGVSLKQTAVVVATETNLSKKEL